MGYILGPEHVVSRLAQLADETYVTANRPSQGMAYEYRRREWLGPNIDKIQGFHRLELGALTSTLEVHLPRAPRVEPEGGFFIGVYLPPEVDTSLLKVRAQEVGVKLSDGRGFFADEDGSAFVRLPLPTGRFGVLGRGFLCRCFQILFHRCVRAPRSLCLVRQATS